MPLSAKSKYSSMNRKLNILILSTHRPGYSAGLGNDIMNCLKDAGHHVDFLCKYSGEFPKRGYRSVLSRPAVKSVVARLLPRCIKSQLKKPPQPQAVKELLAQQGMVFNDPYEIHYPDESVPGIPVDQLLEHVHGKYDLVITLWWFGFINSTSLKAVHDRLQCPVMVLAIDMAPITGGCFYFNECRRFTEQCGRCPALRSDDPEDFTHRNYLIKKGNYYSMNCAFLGNSWMNGFARQSGLFKEQNIFKSSVIIDEEEFAPADRQALRREMGLPKDAVVLLARSSAEPRKGAGFIINALNYLPDSVAAGRPVVLLSIGDEFLSEHICNPHIRHEYMGRVGRSQLIRLYQVSDWFLSPSVDDAGPSMVNQSQMCGTPVVCFNNGTAVDVVVNGQSGFKTDDVTECGYAGILNTAIDLTASSPKEYDEIRTSTRTIAMETCSKHRFSHEIMKYYQLMTS